MNSGFVTPKRVIKRVGIHQRFDSAAYRMIERYVPLRGFPTLKDIISFEGYNGPDGLKVKSPGVNEPSHLYDPIADVGQVPGHIAGHYAGLVRSIKAGDRIRGAFEASWLAHYVCDGMTPAHHFPLEDKVEEAAASARKEIAGDSSRFRAYMKKYWVIWGVKGHMSTHFYFESGIALALLTFPVRATYSDEEMAKAQRLGAVEYFKAESRNIAVLDIYNRFYREGWSPDVMADIKNKIAPLTARAIGMIWLLASVEAGLELALAETTKHQE
jgi:hypothetical protein